MATADVADVDAQTAKAKPKTEPDWANQYGVQIALIESNAELKSLFGRAVTEGWTPANFTANFMNTDWYKTHSDVWRTAYAAEKTDPASWDHEMDLAKNQIQNTAVAAGVELKDKDLNNLARQSLYLSAGSSSRIDPALLKQHVVTAGTITMGGEALTAIEQLKAHDYEMGVSHTDDWYRSLAKSVVGGDSTVDYWKQKSTDVAKSKYSSFADQLDAGMTVRQVASPYMNSMANILEVPASNIDLTDSTINKALTNLGPDSKPTLQPLWQFETSLRKDPRWATTKNAKDAVDSATRSVLSDMGLAY